MAIADYTNQTHPRVAVDAVLFTIVEGALKALLVKIKKGPFAGRWAFPGGLVQVGESLDDAARRELYEKTGVQDLYLEQLYTFGDAQRDPTAPTVAVAYFALVPDQGSTLRSGEKYADIGWFPVRKLPQLAYDHNAIAAYALQRLQAKLGYTNIVYSLLPREFTLAEIQEIYEVILDQRLDRRNFRRKVLALGLLRPLPKTRRGAHRPATLYSFTRRSPMNVEVL
ncbi:MAG TPA: NUDIX domain-containing protein [Candidatus Binatia bacterium]|nr:NUDIX domain-containing protein [Candidatus Binatia bacterium]